MIHSIQRILSRERIGKKEIHLDDEGLVISEKLSENLGVKVGDTIIFENIDNLEKISVLVLKIHKFDNFEILYEKIDKTLIGYSSEEIALSSDMEKYYSIEQQKKYGVLGIEFRITKLNQNL